ncbi:MAG: outer membrane protein [Beijerinckiaceae bacterium]
MFRKFLLSTAALVALGGSAFAADLPSRSAPPLYMPPPPPVFTWTGVYIGGQIGYEWGNSNSALFPTGTSPAAGIAFASSTPSGITGGAHIGYNYQVAQLVFGLEGDANGSSYRGNQLLGAGTLTTSSDIDGSIRGRLGVAFDRALLYGTGGVAFAPFRDQYALGGLVDDTTTTRVGWTVGGGIEYAVTNNWSLRGEYRYTDYGHYGDLLSTTTGGLDTVGKHETDNRVQAGFSYKFDLGGPATPIAAKY